jgi:hypothetical protein
MWVYINVLVGAQASHNSTTNGLFPPNQSQMDEGNYQFLSMVPSHASELVVG